MRTLNSQILGLLFATVFVTSAAILAIFWTNTSSYTQSQVSANLTVATDSFKQLLFSREDQLITSAELLTSDYGFKQAVASRDMATIGSVLYNHGDRVKADLMFLTDLAGTLVASTNVRLRVREPFPHPELIEAAAREGGALSFVRVGDDLYQIVVVTVNAPTPIAFTGVGFRLDQDVANELKALANVEVTFVINGQTNVKTITTLGSEATARIAMGSGDELRGLMALAPTAESSYVTSSVELEGAEQNLGSAYLSVDTSPYIEEFISLRTEILLISLIAIIVSVLLATGFSRNMSQPLAELARIASRIARGEYLSNKAPRRGAEEIQSLFSAVEQMGEDIQRREARITYQAEHDQLTELLNRNTFTEKLDAKLDSRVSMVLACLNIRQFKVINDSFGHEVGDKTLKVIANRLMETHYDDLVGRFGGDEFILAAPIPKGQTADSVVGGLIERLQQPIVISELELSVSFACGYVVYPDDGDNGAALLRRATIALDKARDEQKILRPYGEGEDESHRRSLKLVRDLRTALSNDDGQLFMVYQPKLHLATGRVDKAEALIRWIHPDDGFISPEVFIALAENSSLIKDLTDWVVLQVVRDRARLKSHSPDLQIAINVSAQDLERVDLLSKTLALLQENGLDERCLCFEMTERDMMQDADKVITLMNRFREAGFDLSIDDYGIGQSSLSKLKLMPVNEVKIDKLFVTHIDESKEDRAIAQSTINLGHEFGFRIIAEGVESAKATDVLDALGCDYIQGYHLCRPIKCDELISWLSEFSSQQFRAAAS